jgi:hypothetical protein
MSERTSFVRFDMTLGYRVSTPFFAPMRGARVFGVVMWPLLIPFAIPDFIEKVALTRVFLSFAFTPRQVTLFNFRLQKATPFSRHAFYKYSCRGAQLFRLRSRWPSHLMRVV